ncbi:uncharacterized protein EV420DRAFT_1773092 [Desarmillaria tabescens]|uniref:F-box domain-containing protein n=1 Tax=Armillaria tabescens TaxID=1929756 RepID=A0AA39IWU1_ARMTA|nr:uncharacterized protein EV420DRAFT_1773092 [Desarmillaria tabescens]KAK0431171.1 hypothetical protein EV420DRAFT_1773092 [Desarmillaria tabescens]
MPASRISRETMDVMLHLDAVARSIPEPVFPPEDLNSHVSGILRATRPLLDTDHDWIFPNIEVLQQQISVYDTLLDRIDEIRSGVQSRRDAVKKSLAAYASTLAPIRCLPSDVLRSVFREIQISQWRDTSPLILLGPKKVRRVLDFSQGPWTLSHVCSAWRDIVLSHPRLWSHIVLHFRGSLRLPERRSSSCTIDALKAMIHLSKQHPLHIVFELDRDGDEDLAVRALSVILKESCRWRTLQLRTFPHFLELFKVVRGKIPFLECCALHAIEMPGSGRAADVPEDTQCLFADSPRLQRAILRGAYRLGDFTFPPHITHLATSANNASNLGIYRSLVECHLDVDQRDNRDISLPLKIHLPNVQRLFVTSLRILAHLSLPSLNNLTVYHTNTHIDANTRDVQIVNDFIRRSRCSLSKLVFRSSNIDDQIFIRESLLFMDTLVFLEIMFLWIGATFDALTPVGFLPNLQHLRLFCYDIPSSQDTLIAMISSHSQNLRSVKIYCCDPEDADNISRHIAPLQKPGQHFIITHGPRDETSGLQFGKFTHSDLDAPVDQ